MGRVVQLRSIWIGMIYIAYKRIFRMVNSSINSGGIEAWDSYATSWHGRTDWIKKVVPIPTSSQHRFNVGVWYWRPKGMSVLGNKYSDDIPAYRAAIVQRTFSRIMYAYPELPNSYFVGEPWVDVAHTIIDVYPAPTCGCLPLIKKINHFYPQEINHP